MQFSEIVSQCRKSLHTVQETRSGTHRHCHSLKKAAILTWKSGIKKKKKASSA